MIALLVIAIVLLSLSIVFTTIAGIFEDDKSNTIGLGTIATIQVFVLVVLGLALGHQ